MKDFSKKTISNLFKKGISVVGVQAIPDFAGDKYFSGTAYKLVWNGNGFIRTYSQVIVLASSSWSPETFFDTSLCLFCHKYSHECKCEPELKTS